MHEGQAVRIVDAARVQIRLVGLMAVQGLRQNAGGRRFADAAGSRKQISVMQTVVFDGIAQRLRNVLLAGDLFKSLRPPFSGDHLIGHFVN